MTIPKRRLQANKIVADIMYDLARSTWREKNPQAFIDLLTYVQDMETTVDRDLKEFKPDLSPRVDRAEDLGDTLP